MGLEEGRQYALLVRDGRGDLKSVGAAARSLEGEEVDLIVSITTSVTLAAKRATKSVPIVFYAGSDPVSTGLVESFRKPGGRLTGIHGQGGGLAAKRLELLQRILLGADPGDLPVEQADRPHFVINLKTAKALGLTISPSVLARADEIIQ